MHKKKKKRSRKKRASLHTHIHMGIFGGDTTTTTVEHYATTQNASVQGIHLEANAAQIAFNLLIIINSPNTGSPIVTQNAAQRGTIHASSAGSGGHTASGFYYQGGGGGFGPARLF